MSDSPFKDYRLTSPFGMRMHPVDRVMKFHRGVDLVTSPSDGPLYAFVAGTVMYANDGVAGSGFGGMGNVVAIKDDKGFLHCYVHLSMITVKVGQTVTRGQMIGRQGSTGKSTGPHLHYEVRKKSSPSMGWTDTEAGVVEPTQYLIDYYKEAAPVVTKPEVVQEWEKAGVKYLKDKGLTATERGPKEIVSFAELGLILERFGRLK